MCFLNPCYIFVQLSTGPHCARPTTAHDNGSMRVKQLCNTDSHGGGPRCSHSVGRSSCSVPHCSHHECYRHCGVWPPPPTPPPASAATTIARPRQLAVLCALLLAQDQQQRPQSVSHRRNACRHGFAGGVDGDLPYQQRASTWRGSNAGMSSPGGRIRLLTSFTICHSVHFLRNHLT